MRFGYDNDLNINVGKWLPLLIIMGVVLFSLSSCYFIFIKPVIRVWQQEQEGKAILARANQERQILVTQATAEKEAALERAEAIRIVGEAAQKYPEYRQQEFMGAFAEAIKSDSIQKIIYVPTEANIPITESRRGGASEKSN